MTYFSKHRDANEYLKILANDDWKVINYTPSTVYYHPYERFSINDEENVHGIIGQEFDKVVAIIDEHFCYERNVLSVKNYEVTPYYNPVKMLYQIMSRARNQLAVIVIDNEEIMAHCLSILN